MASDIIVSDAGPMISLEKLSDGYGWMQQLYGQVLIPGAVAQELYQGMFSNWEAYRSHYNFGDFISVVEVTTTETFPGYDLLDVGERQAIQLAWKQQLPLLIEEEQGRQVAKALGLTFSGLAGQILKAYREQVISSTVAQASLAELLKTGRIGKRLYAGLLETLDQ
ncbi:MULTISPECIES: hypothetical protein [Cyanophyceae]|uniref:hypothetical protein n=1 Tax=Cyanophyceae TaxID=3028117 RepID=UPI00168645F6|nr:MULTISPECIES: hypothetical protein [Cyanophyceae]MBD1919317.1 hypothetical protein [Phormidium sp. FACHB-77]MBD2033036.1 hypothetical protein [Phormidium sp. FACHB-322]MBD2054224.1 hypothetical protein [Leptolyngbya sp. FACHB-60]